MALADAGGRRLPRMAAGYGLPVRVAGRLTGTPVFRILGLDEVARPDLQALWEGTIPRIMSRTESSR